MTTGVACPTPILQFFDARGNPLVGGSVLTQVGGVNAPTYSDSALATPLPNPIPLNSRGEVSTAAGASSQLFLTPNTVYQFTAFDANGNQIWVANYVNGIQLSAIIVGDAIWPQTQDEKNAGVVPDTAGASRPWTDACIRYGLVGDGATDNTAAFAAMCSVAGQSLLIKRGTYITGKFTLPEYTTLYLEPGTIIKDSGVLGANDCVMTVSSNCRITGWGAAVDGNKAAYAGHDSEFRFAVNVLAVSNVCIEGLTAQNADGDGFYVGASTGAYCEHITLLSCTATGNRRNGLSITAAIGCWVIGGEYMNTAGTDPQYGIDVEPNDSTTPIQDVHIIGVRTSGNAKGGIQIAPQGLSTTTGNPISVEVIGHESDNDNTTGTSGQAGARITGSQVSSWNNQLYGRIVYRDGSISKPGCSGIRVDNWDQAHSPEAFIENVTVYDAANFGVPANVQDQCGAVIFGGPGLTMPIVGNIKLKNVRVYDDRGVPQTYTGLYIYNSVAALSNYLVEDVRCIGFTPTSGANSDVVILGAGASNGQIRYSYENVVSVAASDAAVRYLGKTILATAACVITLPTAAVILGQPFKVVAGVSASIQLRPTAGDVIEFWGGSGTGDVVLNWLGDEIVVRAYAANQWSVEQISDGAKRPLGQSKPAHQIWNTAAPASGTWELGAICWNAAPAVGIPKGWVCTAAGTPGTWTSMGNL